MRSPGASVLSLVAFDMDGTLVDTSSSWKWVHDHFGESNSVALRLFLNDQIDDQEFIRRDIALWWEHKRDLTVDDLETILAGVPLMPGAQPLFEGLRRKGIHTAIISGGIDLLARRVARELGIDYVLANGFRVTPEGRLTGEGIIRVRIKHKDEALRSVQEQLGVGPESTASVGNSEIDTRLFARSRVGVAFLPEDDEVRRAATAVVEQKNLALLLPLLEG
jgi:phosphoserine phosphatase